MTHEDEVKAEISFLFQKIPVIKNQVTFLREISGQIPTRNIRSYFFEKYQVKFLREISGQIPTRNIRSYFFEKYQFKHFCDKYQVR
jgi:hypothetical protein